MWVRQFHKSLNLYQGADIFQIVHNILDPVEWHISTLPVYKKAN